MITAISTALSGLNADTDAINVVGNDLANLNTTGYKANELEFQDLMAVNLGVSGTSGQLGLGLGQVDAVTNYSQGSITTTNGATDAAIQGNGFFVANDPTTGQTLYTRDGSFQVNSAGQLTTASGQLVQGWSAVNGVVNTNGAIGNLTMPVGTTIPATATTTMNLGMNLDSSGVVGQPSGTVTAPIQVYDSQGVVHDLTATYTKTGNNTWTYDVTIPAADVGAAGPAPVSVANGTMTFDANGNLTSPTFASGPQAVNISGLADGASNMTVNWNLYDTSGNPTITQYSEASSVNSTTQNGYAAGTVSSVALQNSGGVMATYTNGQQILIGQLALAQIANPQSLSQVGNNNLAVTANTSTPVIGAAGTGGRGQIIAGAVESSTVDIATEFANLLTFQRSYQADSRVITTADQLTQETVNLIHS